MTLTTQAQTSHLLEIVELPDLPSLEFALPDTGVVQEPESDVEVLEAEPPSEVPDTERLPEPFELVVDELPGVSALDPELEQALQISEQDKEKDKKKDENDAKNSKKVDKWNWESKGAKGFIAWIKERLQDVPKHSGYEESGVERAIAFMEKLDNEISRAMRLDLDGELNADQIEEVRAKIDEGIERLHDRLEKVKKKGKNKKRKKAEEQMELIKQAQKMPTVSGIVITVPLYVSAICRSVINGMVSGGHDAQESFAKLSKKYNLTERERFECIVHMQDMGLTVRQDRGTIGEDFDPHQGGIDFAANYYA